MIEDYEHHGRPVCAVCYSATAMPEYRVCYQCWRETILRLTREIEEVAS